MGKEVTNSKLLNLPLHEIKVGPFREFISTKSWKLGPERAYRQQKWVYLPTTNISFPSGIQGEVVDGGLTRPVWSVVMITSHEKSSKVCFSQGLNLAYFFNIWPIFFVTCFKNPSIFSEIFCTHQKNLIPPVWTPLPRFLVPKIDCRSLLYLSGPIVCVGNCLLWRSATSWQRGKPNPLARCCKKWGIPNFSTSPSMKLRWDHSPNFFRQKVEN